MSHHVFDLTETATHHLVAEQLRALADQLAAGRVDLSYDEWQEPTAVVDPVEVTVDLKRRRHHWELAIDMRWTAGEAAAHPAG
jgi:amphi-Trp domain-containing protein